MSTFRSLLTLSFTLSLLAGCLAPPSTPSCASMGWADSDGDGFGDAAAPLTDCDEGVAASNDNDCDDADEARFPGAPELCDDIDNDCDGEIDEEAIDPPTWWPDTDGDGYGDDAGSPDVGCDPVSAAWAAQPGDCDDKDGSVYEGAAPICGDDVDNDCDGQSDCEVGFAGELWADEATVLLTAADGTAEFGSAVFSPGDVTGDGVADVVAGMDWDVEQKDTTLDIFAAPMAGDQQGDLSGPGLGTSWHALTDVVQVGDSASEEGRLLLGQLDLDGVSGRVCAVDAEMLLTRNPMDAPCVSGWGTGAALVSLPAFAGATGPLVAVASPSENSGGGRVTLLDPQDLSLPDVESYPNYLYGVGSQAALGAGALAAGDVNGDGTTDLLVPGTAQVGTYGLEFQALYLVTEAVVGAVAIEDAAAAWLISDERDTRFGSAMSMAADLDGDGLEDAIVGAPSASGGGGVYLLTAQSWARAGVDRGVNAAAAARIHGTGVEALGSAVVALHDFNGDGLSEVAAGAPDAYGSDLRTGESIQPGAAYVWTSPFEGVLSSSAPSGSGGPAFTVHGTVDAGRLGATLAAGVDLDGHGGEELLIGAPGADSIYLFASDPL